MNAPTPKRNSEDIEDAILNLATPRDWLQLKAVTGHTKAECIEDDDIMTVFLAYLWDKSEDRSVDKWLDSSSKEVKDHLNLDEDELPKAAQDASGPTKKPSISTKPSTSIKPSSA